MDITFRELTEDDLPQMHRWLNEPGVVTWWEGDDVSWDGVVADYGPDKDEHVEHWVASAGDRDIGWVQCWPIAKEPEAIEKWSPLGVDQDGGGMDYLLGEPADRGAGLGSAMLGAFVTMAFARHPSWTQLAADPVVANTASWRALEKAGLRHLGDYDDEELGPCRLMVVDRPNEA